jgi:hypothetical protein
MTEPHDTNDELIASLADADPVAGDQLPDATSPHAQQLLEDIMTSTPPSRDNQAPDSLAADGDTTPVLDLPQVEGIDRYAAPRRQRLAVIAAVAAVFLAVVGFIVVSPSGTEPALASVHSAARATAEAERGRSMTTFELQATDGEMSETVAGRVATEFDGTNVAATIDLDELSAEANSFVPTSVDVRLVDGVIYGRDGDSWYAFETGGAIGQTAVEQVDPRSVLETVQDLVATTEIGPAVIDGVDTTHYQSVVDLADESLRESGWLPVDTAEIEADGELTIDLYVDDDGLLRQLVVSGDAVATDGSNGAATLLVTSSFFDFGADITIEAPEAAEFIDPGTHADELDRLELDELELDD